MKKVILILGLLVIISGITFNSLGKKGENNHFTVRASISNNSHTGAVINCEFLIYDGGTFVEEINVPLVYNGNGTYVFNSWYDFDSNDSFIYYITGADSQNYPYTNLCKTGSGNPTNWYVITSASWNIPK
jgi:hypothetical protein